MKHKSAFNYVCMESINKKRKDEPSSRAEAETQAESTNLDTKGDGGLRGDGETGS